MKGSYLKDCLSRRVLFFTGKGGVGKSTLAWATALLCRRQNRRVALASWSPFDADTRPQITQTEGVDWLPLETLSAFKEYALQILKFEKLYDTVFENHVLKTFLRAAPGLSETVISGKIWNLYQKREYDLLIVDLPSSGHAISFFQSPLGIRKAFSMGFVHKEAEKICEMFQNPDCRVDIVTLPEEMPMVESEQLCHKLSSLHALNFGYLHINERLPTLELPSELLFRELPETVKSCRERYVKRKAAEEETLILADKLPLSRLEIPTFALAHMSDTVLKVADHLEAM